MLYAFFWVILRRLNFIFRRFGTLSVSSLWQVGACRILHAPTCLWRWNRHCSEMSAYKIHTPGNRPKESKQHSFIMFIFTSTWEKLSLRWRDFSKVRQENSSFVEIWREKRVLYMKADVYLWQYLAHFFLEWEMFQTKVVEKIKTLILRSILFSRKSCCLWDYVEKYCGQGQATDDNIKRCRKDAVCLSDN